MNQVPYVVYNSSTGEIIRHGHCIDADVPIQAQFGEAVIQCEFKHGSVANGVLVPLNATQLEAKESAYRQALIANHRAMRKQKLN
jgi:hypothetical protein